MFAPHSPRILVIDDDQEVCRLLQLLLLRTGIQTVSATSAERADQLLRDLPRPDGIILDLMLPRRSGLEILSWLRSLPTLRDVPVTVLTARSDATAHQQALALGAAAVLIKPSGMREVIGAVRHMLAARSA